MIFETHAHYDDEKFDEDRELLLKEMTENDVRWIVNVAASMETARNTIALTEKYDYIYGAIGVHPNEVEELNEHHMEWLKEKSALEKIVAIGEIGLDYYYDEPTKEIQREWFVKQINLAREVKLPMIIHSRDAAQDTLSIMKKEKCGEIGGVVHCYSYSIELAKEFLDMGFYIGVGGVVTFPNGKKLKEVVDYLPMDRIVLETDSPYLSPAPLRGKRNNSMNIKYIAEEIAGIKNISVEEVYDTTYQNALKLYRLNKGV